MISWVGTRVEGDSNTTGGLRWQTERDGSLRCFSYLCSRCGGHWESDALGSLVYHSPLNEEWIFTFRVRLLPVYSTISARGCTFSFRTIDTFNLDWYGIVFASRRGRRHFLAPPPRCKPTFVSSLIVSIPVPTTFDTVWPTHSSLSASSSIVCPCFNTGMACSLILPAEQSPWFYSLHCGHWNIVFIRATRVTRFTIDAKRPESCSWCRRVLGPGWPWAARSGTDNCAHAQTGPDSHRRGDTTHLTGATWPPVGQQSRHEG